MAAGSDAQPPHISPDIGICRGYFELSSALAIPARSTLSAVRACQSITNAFVSVSIKIEWIIIDVVA